MHGPMYGHMWNGPCAMPGGPGNFGYGGTWFIVGLALLVLAGLIVWLVVSRHSKRERSESALATAAAAAPRPSGEDTAESIARERLARGEIEPDEYARIMAALQG